jgi:polyisoprenoid-binding protein YceI
MRFAIVVTLAALCVPAMASASAAERLAAGPADGHVAVSVYKAGLLSAFAHDHHFSVTRWSATADLPDGDPGRVALEVVLDADSLHDTQQGPSADERREIDARAAGPEVLDATHHPRVVFRSERTELVVPAGVAAASRGTLHGTLTLRGRSIPLDVPFEAERSSAAWTVRGRLRVKQSVLGIRPFSGFGGTVKVKDELEIEFAFDLTPRPPGSDR